jgi:hypothetical protein
MRYRFSITLNAPLERTFDFATDPANFLSRLPGQQFEQTPPGGLGPGTRIRVIQSRMPDGFVEVLELERPHRLVTRSDYGTGPFITVTTFRVTPDMRTVIRIDGELALVGLPSLMRPLTPVLGLVLRPLVWRENRRVGSFLRKALEE